MTIAQILSALSDKQAPGEIRQVPMEDADALQQQWARNKDRFLEALL